jgi:hypothetical protein
MVDLGNINFNGSDHVVVVWFASAKAARFDISQGEEIDDRGARASRRREGCMAGR